MYVPKYVWELRGFAPFLRARSHWFSNPNFVHVFNKSISPSYKKFAKEITRYKYFWNTIPIGREEYSGERVFKSTLIIESNHTCKKYPLTKMLSILCIEIDYVKLTLGSLVSGFPRSTGMVFQKFILILY